MRAALRVTFDTNTYSVVARPQIGRIFSKFWPLDKDRMVSMRNRACWWYLNWCIRRGRIIAAIPEASLKAEVLPNVQRVSALLAVGTAAAATPPTIAPTRLEIIQAAFDMGFLVLRSPRIAWGALYPVPPERWAPDAVHSQVDRQARESVFVRHFNNYALELIKDCGEQLSKAHGLAALPQNAQYALAASLNKITLDRYLWREGLAAEEAAPMVSATVSAFQKQLRNLLADWVDFEVVAVHYAYGFDILCSQDRGTNPNSIFGAPHQAALQDMFDVRVMNIIQLTRACLSRFGIPLSTWRS
jgi:hypothetical protein